MLYLHRFCFNMNRIYPNIILYINTVYFYNNEIISKKKIFQEFKNTLTQINKLIFRVSLGHNINIYLNLTGFRIAKERF